MRRSRTVGHAGAGPTLAWLLALVLSLAPGLAAAVTERLTDLAPSRQVRVDLQWAPIQWQRGDRDPAYHLMSADVPRIEYRLDVARYVGRQVRVLYVIPLDAGLTSPLGLKVRWKSQGALRAGEARAGDRVTVFEGRVAAGSLDDVFDVHLEVDSRYFTGRLRFDPYFEIDAP
ncbi:MAG: hypothetical protein KAY46_04985 [Burkholderiaceae bacterium]|nr:hypothetical protein [Burkholderiaceae bacterium]